MYCDRDPRWAAHGIQDARYRLRYSPLGEAAGFVEHQDLIYIRHHFLLIDPGDAIVPSAPFRRGLTRLLVGATTTRQSHQNPQDNNENQLSCQVEQALHHFSLFTGLRVVLPP